MRSLARIAFWVYAALLFTATHWPSLRIESTLIERPDIIIHMCTFGTWALLLLATGYLSQAGQPAALKDPPGAPWRLTQVVTMRGVLLGGLVALLYAAFDEGTQAFPFLHRTCAWDDYVANAGGILLVTLIAGLVARRHASRSARTPGRSE